MKTITLKQLAEQVKEVRNTQKLYFLAKGRAARTKLPTDFADAAHLLQHSKTLERAVDETVMNVLKAEEEVVG